MGNRPKHAIRSTFIALLFSLLGGCCELCYDPAFTDEAPPSPGESWKRRPIIYPKETFRNPFTAADLSATMPVSQLLDIALFNNPSTRTSWNAARAAAYAHRASLSEFYPSLLYSSNITSQRITTEAASGAASTTSQNPTTSTSATTKAVTTTAATTAAVTSTSGRVTTKFDTYFNEITASYLLFDFGGRNAQAELALQILYAANWQHNFTMQQVLMRVLDAYTAYIGNKALVVADEQNLKDAEVTLTAALTMRNAGLSTLTDVLQAQSAVEIARTNLIQAQSAEKISLANLLIAIGLPPETKICVQDLPQELPVIEISGDINSFLELAKRKRPDIGVAIAAVKQQEAQLAISYSSGMPIFTANANASKQHYIHNAALDVGNNNVSIALNFPLFQGFFYINQQRQIRAQIQEALANLDVQLSQIATEVATNYYTFLSAVGVLPSSEANLDFTQRAFRGILSQYKVGTSSILDVLNALSALSSARAQLAIARTQWAASLANLAFAVGVLGETKEEWQEAPPKDLFNIPFKDDDNLSPKG